MGFLKKITQLFSVEPTPAMVFPTTEYKGFCITPQPMAEGGQFRVAGIIKKGEGEDLKQHHFIRSDTNGDVQKTAELTLLKCKILIDQVGAGMFQ